MSLTYRDSVAYSFQAPAFGAIIHRNRESQGGKPDPSGKRGAWGCPDPLPHALLTMAFIHVTQIPSSCQSSVISLLLSNPYLPATHRTSRTG